MGQSTVQFRVIGGFEVIGPDGADLTPRGRKSRGILAYLALNRGIDVQRSKLVDLFWSDRGQTQGLASLRQAIREIKQCCGGMQDRLLEIRRNEIRLNGEVVSLDLWDAQGTINDHLTDPLLEGLDPTSPVFDDWLDTMRRGVNDRQVNSAQRRLGQLGPDEDPEKILEICDTILKLDPCNEPAVRIAMPIFAAQEKTAQLIEMYERLQTELLRGGFQVSPKTYALYEDLRDERKTISDLTPLPDVIADGVPLVAFVVEAADALTLRQTGQTEEFADLMSARLTSMPEIRLTIVDANDRARIDKSAFSLNLKATPRDDTLVLKLILKDDGGITPWKATEQIEISATEADLIAAVDRSLTLMLPKLEATAATRINAPASTAYGNYLLAKQCFFAANSDHYMFDVEALLEKAIDIDPTFVPAYDHLIQSYNTGHFMTRPGLDLAEPRKRALDLAQRFLALNSQYPNAHIAMGWCQLWLDDHQAAERSIVTAIDLKPYEAHRLNSIGTMLVYLGDHDGGERFYKQARDRMANDLDYQRSDYGELYYLKGDFQTALSHLGVTERRAPYRTMFWRAATHAQLGNLAEARMDIQTLAEDIGARWAGPAPYTADDGLAWYIGLKRFRRAIDTDIMLDGLAKAGVEI